LQALQRFDALSVCSDEDADLLPSTMDVHCIGNGAVDRRTAYLPSPSTSPNLLFIGPFRYPPNRDAIRDFVDLAWPSLRARFPDLRLTVLSGGPAPDGALDACLKQNGIDCVNRFVDPAPYLAACSLSINPLRAIRGSPVKLIESLLAGRICVSTRDGARGFADAGLEGLVLADDIAAMADSIAALLDNPGERHRRERADDSRLDAFTWDAMADKQMALYERLLQGASR
jgi:glycosyltransferase involved in cell wall biosynthesis